MDWIKTVKFENVKPKIASMIAVLHSKGIKKIAMIGFCWGGWCLFKSVAEFSDITAGAIIHPAVHLEMYAYEGDIGALSAKVTIPMLVLPAGNDPDIYREGGAVTAALQANNSKSTWNDDFKDMQHGFVPRGDISDAIVESKVKLALQQVYDFISANI
jgi:dienelactone hydrolase